MDKLFLVMLGGALGSGARYLVGLAANERLPGSFPWGTWIVNVVGSFAMGIVAWHATSSTPWSPATRAFVATGVLGGFTTYSSFNQETLNYVHAEAWGSAALYGGATAIACLVAGFAGMAAARSIAGS